MSDKSPNQGAMNLPWRRVQQNEGHYALFDANGIFICNIQFPKHSVDIINAVNQSALLDRAMDVLKSIWVINPLLSVSVNADLFALLREYENGGGV